MAFEEIPADVERAQSPTSSEAPPAPPPSTPEPPPPAPEPPQPAPGTEEASQFSTYTGPGGRISQTHRDRISHPDFVSDLHDLAHQHANATPDQQQTQAPQQSQAPDQPPPINRGPDPQFLRPSALNPGTYSHRDFPNRVFTQAEADAMRDTWNQSQQSQQQQAPDPNLNRQPGAGTFEAFFARLQPLPGNPGWFVNPDDEFDVYNTNDLVQIRNQWGTQRQGPQQTPPPLPPQAPPNGPQQGPVQGPPPLPPMPPPLPPQPQAIPFAQPMQGPPQMGTVPNFIRRHLTMPATLQQPYLHNSPTITMDEVLAKEERRENFFKMLERRGHADLAARFHLSRTDRSAMRDQDWMALEGELNELDRREKLAEEVKANMTNEDVHYLLQTNALFAPLRASLTPDRAAQLIRDNIKNVFMTSTDDEVNRMVWAQRANRDIRMSPNYARLAERTRAKVGPARPENVNWNAVDSRLFNRVVRGAWLRPFQITRQKQIATLDATEANLNVMTTILGASLDRDDELYARIIAGAEAGGKVPEPTITGPRTIQEAGREREAIGRELALPGLRTAAAAFKDRMIQENRWAGRSPADRKQEFLRPVKQREAQMQGRSRSWFGSVLSAIFSSLVESVERDQQLDAVFAT